MTGRRCRCRALGASLLGLLPLASSCLPDFDEQSSRVEARRVLAVVAEPAEARPGARVRFTPLVATPDGRERAPGLTWTFCTVPRPSVERRAVADGCLLQPGPALELQPGGIAAASLPLDACARFGPDPPPGDARPRDPDQSGGFYQPLVIFGGESIAIHLQRLICNSRSTPVDVARQLAAEYVPNQNPPAPELLLDAGSTTGAEAPRVAPGGTLELSLTWPPGAAESYAWVDPERVRVVMRREALLISWFTSAGAFDLEHHDVSEDDPSTTRHNRWTAPDSSGPVHFWAVLRDSRGGTSFVERTLLVTD